MKRNRTDYIVLHTAAWPGDPSIDDIRRVHVQERGWDDVGYHYLIRKDGTIETGRPKDHVGAHCRDRKMNYKSVGICLSGDHDTEDPTYKQLISLSSLVNTLRRHYDIPIENVIGHRETGANKTCPGTQIHMQRLRDFIEDQDIEGIDRVEQLETVNVSDLETPNPPKGGFRSAPENGRSVDEIAMQGVKGPSGRRWFVRTLAGQSTWGKIGAVAKNIIKDYLPAGPLLDRLTDRIGQELQPKTHSTMLKSKDPKTTVTGIILIIAGIASFFGADSFDWDFASIAATLTPILTGAGLLAARDNRRKQKP